MSPHLDGMPEGHPERRPMPLATLTLLTSSLDAADSTISGELRIHVPVPQARTEEVFAAVRAAMHNVLDAESPDVFTFSVPCGCGSHHEGGERA